MNQKTRYAYDVLPVPDQDIYAIEAGFVLADVILLTTIFNEWRVVRDC